MSIRLAKKVGFCFGVKRAVEMAEEVLKKENRAYSLGSIIHNREVVEALSRKGLKVIAGINDATSGCVVVSSHGISPNVHREISKRSLELVDTTCPFVSNAQKMAQHLSGAGYRIVIVGDANHPEVKALVDFAGRKTIVVKNPGEIRRLRLRPNSSSSAASMVKKIGVLSQTTQSMDNFLEVIKALIEVKPKELRVYNTICKDAEERQVAARSLARNVDLMLIVGGRHSANTKRLLDVCKNILDKSYLIETEKDLDGAWFKKAKKIGITSGASTPDWLVRRVVDEVRIRLRNQ
jgi:4-hydroxy-3-methylbut-2-en-1-yl diphosphate reductase